MLLREVRAASKRRAAQRNRGQLMLFVLLLSVCAGTLFFSRKMLLAQQQQQQEDLAASRAKVAAKAATAATAVGAGSPREGVVLAKGSSVTGFEQQALWSEGIGNASAASVNSKPTKLSTPLHEGNSAAARAPSPYGKAGIALALQPRVTLYEYVAVVCMLWKSLCFLFLRNSGDPVVDSDMIANPCYETISA